MSTAVAPVENVTRHREDVAPLLEREPRCNQGPALLARLDDHHRPRQAADDPVSERKEMRQRRCAWNELADDGAAVTHRGGKPAMFAGIDDVNATAKHTDGPTG